MFYGSMHTIKVLESIKNDLMFEKIYDNDKISDQNTKKLYNVIIGAFKDFNNAKDFKQIYIREYNISPKIIRNKNDSWYFLCDESSSTQTNS